MNSALSTLIKRRSKILILQADWEAGMCKIVCDLESAGHMVEKVAFSYSDKVYVWHGFQVVDYTSPLVQFKAWLESYIRLNKIDTLLLYNQFRPYNAIGWQVAGELDLQCIVLELGLLRPDFTTIYDRKTEPFTYFKKHWASLRDQAPAPFSSASEELKLTKSSSQVKLSKMAAMVILSRAMMRLGRYQYFLDQRRLTLRHHLSAVLKGFTRFIARNYQKSMASEYWGEKAGMYYVVPLQVHCDSQITLKSQYECMRGFIAEVAQSFLAYAPTETQLIFKVHPMDRGYRDYGYIIDEMNRREGRERFVYLDRIHLPSCMRYAKGCITVNSSVGLSALINGTPTICMGQAIYDLEGLTFQGCLKQFWTSAPPVDRNLVQTFLSALRDTTQAQGVLYQKIFNLPNESRLIWPRYFNDFFIPVKRSKPIYVKHEHSTYSTTPSSQVEAL